MIGLSNIDAFYRPVHYVFLNRYNFASSLYITLHYVKSRSRIKVGNGHASRAYGRVTTRDRGLVMG